MRPAVAVVVALWDPVRSDAVLAELRQLYAAHHRVTVVGVVNSDRVRFRPESQPDHVVRGSNADAEFSAYDEGLGFLRDSGTAADVLVLANDRAFSYAPAPPLHQVSAVVTHVTRHRLAAGHVDWLPRPVRVMGRRVGSYLRSNHVVTPYAPLAADFTVTSLPRAAFDDLVPVRLTDPAPTAPFAALGSEEYARFLEHWLTGSGGGDHWYRARPRDENSWPVLRLKAKSVVNEHLLSARLSASGLRLVPFADAASPLVRNAPGRVLLGSLGAARVAAWRVRGSVTGPGRATSGALWS